MPAPSGAGERACVWVAGLQFGGQCRAASQASALGAGSPAAGLLTLPGIKYGGSVRRRPRTHREVEELAERWWLCVGLPGLHPRRAGAGLHCPWYGSSCGSAGPA